MAHMVQIRMWVPFGSPKPKGSPPLDAARTEVKEGLAHVRPHDGQQPG